MGALRGLPVGQSFNGTALSESHLWGIAVNAGPNLSNGSTAMSTRQEDLEKMNASRPLPEDVTMTLP